MDPEAITRLFDQQAENYDQTWAGTSALNGALHLLTFAALSELPPAARILCVGAGTGAEILALAERFPGWHFTAVEPSAPMLEKFRGKAEARAILSRCTLHAGYLDSLPGHEPFHAATAFLVSQFITDRAARVSFFQSIARRLLPDGLLISSDLSSDLDSVGGRRLLEIWFQMMNGNGVSEEGIARMREAYRGDVAVLPPDQVREILADGGFETPLPIFQAGLIRAWCAKRQ